MKQKLVVKSFFSEEELDTVQTTQTQTDCSLCGLYKNCKSPKTPPSGGGSLKILIITDTQFKEDEEKYLREILTKRGYDLDKQFWLTSSVICSLTRKPTKRELKLCRHNYLEYIKEKNPKFIWVMGPSAIESFFMGRFSDEGGNLTPARWRSLCIPDPVHNCYVVPMYHPSYAIRMKWDTLTQAQYERDLDFAISCLKKSAPSFYDVEKYVTCLDTFSLVKDFLVKLTTQTKLFTFDYESTGLKPFNSGHKIACASVCFEDDRAYAFPLQHPVFTESEQNELMNLWKQVLENDAPKVAHALKFEDIWSTVIANAFVKNWESCTMNTAHILDNRTAFSGLKFQAFIRWGIQDYDRAMKPYLKSNGAELNRVMEAPLDKLLLYNGIDSLLTFWLYYSQEAELGNKEKEYQQFNKRGLIALADVQRKGIRADREYYKNVDTELEGKINDIYKRLYTSQEAKLFKEKKHREISFTSDKDLRELFFVLMKLKPPKFTDTGLPSVDADAIASIGCTIAKDLSEVSKLEKLKSTYVGQFLREINDDGRIHAFYDLHKVSTHRSSASMPNMQNLPVRDQVVSKYARSGLFPSKSNLIVEADYGALEVRIAGCITEDPMLIAYINDPTTDMHRDIASEIFSLDTNNVSKDLRFYAKNGFVFPQIYGSYYKNCAKAIWKACKDFQLQTKEGQDIFDYLMSAHIINHKTDYLNFEEHVKEVEKDFWDRFKVIRKWQEKTVKFYENNGYIQLVTGPKCRGFLTRNDLFNWPIQGPAFHCLLYSLIHLNDYHIEHNMNTAIIGQIHDCMLQDTDPNEKEEVIKATKYIATEQIRKDWKWIIVPLDIEIETTEIDGSWYQKKEEKE